MKNITNATVAVTLKTVLESISVDNKNGRKIRKRMG